MKPLDEHDPYFDLSGEQGLGEETESSLAYRAGLPHLRKWIAYAGSDGWTYALLAIALGLVMALVMADSL